MFLDDYIYQRILNLWKRWTQKRNPVSSIRFSLKIQQHLLQVRRYLYIFGIFWQRMWLGKSRSFLKRTTVCTVEDAQPASSLIGGERATYLVSLRVKTVVIKCMITRKLWNRNSTFRLKLWLKIVQLTWSTATVQCKQTHFINKWTPSTKL